MRVGVIISLIVSSFLWACAPIVAVKKGYDFSQIQKVAVLYFDGEGVSGRVVSDEFIRQLVQSGVEVVERHHIEKLLQEKKYHRSLSSPEEMQNAAQLLGVDAFFTGTVSLYQPDQRFLVTFDNHDNVIEQPVIQMYHSKYYHKDDRLDDDAYILYVGSVVSVSVRLIDARTGIIVWANNITYESLEISHAVSSIVNYFLRSLRPYWPKQL